jgi:hypothetical protein
LALNSGALSRTVGTARQVRFHEEPASGERLKCAPEEERASTVLARLLRRLARVRWPYGVRRVRRRQQVAADIYGQALSLRTDRRLRDLDRATRLEEW